ncbi:hypothetical protein [Paraburkholderia sp.]|uniref:hypothetical protein n=1 Tax=Paraburkholderia sp. TaxID=1926495 RepID=UPI0039E70FFB
MEVSTLSKALAAVARCRGDIAGAFRMSLARWGEGSPATLLLRAAITTGALGDDHAFAAMIAGVPTQSIIAAIDRISPWRRAAPNVPVLCESAPPQASWRNEGQVIAVSSADFETVRVNADKSIAGILVFTVEAGRELGDAFMGQLSNDAGGAINYAESDALLNPANDGTGTAPASLTHDAIKVQSTGSTAEAIRNDLATLLAQFGGDMSRAVWAVSSRTATQLALHGAALGSADVNVTGGFLAGLPLCAARGVPDSVLALIDPSGIVLFDGGAQFATSEQSMLTMPDGSVRSLWDENLGALRFIRVLDWQAGRAGCVAAITGIQWAT